MTGTGATKRETDKAGAGASLLHLVEATRKKASLRLDPKRRVQMGQFLTPEPVASFMVGMLDCRKRRIRILDPGAGIGSLSAALVQALCRRSRPPAEIALTAYEIDPTLLDYLQVTFDHCRAVCQEKGILFHGTIAPQDFLEAGAAILAGELFKVGQEHFDCAILNPPYRKISSDSRERKLLRSIGLETTNLYTGFLAMAVRLLVPGGELVAITPRSFCNGPYFHPFRRYFLEQMRFRRIHVFDARNSAFADDEVLQENVVFHGIKGGLPGAEIIISASRGPDDPGLRMRTITLDELVRPDDRQAVIHIVPDESGKSIRRRVEGLEAALSELDLAVSTGKVVDFRAKRLLRTQPGQNTVPLIHPCHLRDGFVEWPNGRTRKPNALALGPGADELLVPKGYYVLTKRFSAKEERRRIVAAVYDPERVPAARTAFENHLNFYHAQGAGLTAAVAKGLAAFLNSTLVDTYFRQFSGHTQVNASDLRSLRYPSNAKLVVLGSRIGGEFPPQDELDHLVDEVLFHG